MANLSRAMEFMGWKVPEVDGDEEFEEVFEEEVSEPVRDFKLHTFQGGEDYSEPVSPSAALRRIVTVHPTSYADARLIGESFRDGVPVIINLTELDDKEARRIIDFAAGLVFGLHGVIEKVTPRVFLLSPADVEVSGSTPKPTPLPFG